MPRSLPLVTAAVIGAMTLAVTACGSSSHGASPQQSTTTAATASDAGSSSSVAYGPVPAGTVLNVGDQQQELETLFKVSGVEAQLPFKVNFVEFASGPLVDSGFAAGRIDVGGMGDLPAALTQSSNLPVRVLSLAKSLGTTPELVLLAKPGISSIAQLRGKPVAYTTGTEEQSLALSALASAGLDQSDVHQVNVTLEQLFTVLEAGEADASVISSNQELIYKQSHPGATVLYSNLTANPPIYQYELATTAALANPAKLAALKDFVEASIEASNWAQQNTTTWANDYLVGVEHETPAQAQLGVSELDEQDVPFTPAIQSAEQQVVNLQAQAGAIKQSFSVAPLYADTSWLSTYDQILQEVHQDG